jgi:hypothetical protein
MCVVDHPFRRETHTKTGCVTPTKTNAKTLKAVFKTTLICDSDSPKGCKLIEIIPSKYVCEKNPEITLFTSTLDFSGCETKKSDVDDSLPTIEVEDSNVFKKSKEYYSELSKQLLAEHTNSLVVQDSDGTYWQCSTLIDMDIKNGKAGCKITSEFHTSREKLVNIKLLRGIEDVEMLKVVAGLLFDIRHGDCHVVTSQEYELTSVEIKLSDTSILEPLNVLFDDPVGVHIGVTYRGVPYVLYLHDIDTEDETIIAMKPMASDCPFCDGYI